MCDVLTFTVGLVAIVAAICAGAFCWGYLEEWHRNRS